MVTHEQIRAAAAAGRLPLGDGVSVNRLGFGTMRLTGPVRSSPAFVATTSPSYGCSARRNRSSATSGP